MSQGDLSRDWARKLDARAIDEYGVIGLVLMENAGRGCAQLLVELGISGPVVIGCGRGNNAGDGFVIARHLDAWGYAVKVLVWGQPERLRGDAAINFEILRRAEIPLVVCAGRMEADWLRGEMAGADWIVDALLGTGSEGEPRPPLDTVLAIFNSTAAKKLAVDLPSGLDCDTGQPARHTFRADHTATFVAPKIGFRQPAAQPYLGQVHVVDIGAPKKLVNEILARTI